MIYNIILQALICGVATAAICRTIVYYDGPFQVFPRFQQSLLPQMFYEPVVEKLGEICTIEELQEKFASVMMAVQADEGNLELWKIYQTKHNPSFYRSFKGTLYGIMDCPFCLGPYVSLFMAMISTAYVYNPSINQMGLGVVSSLLSLILVASGSYGIHFIISKYWSNGDTGHV